MSATGRSGVPLVVHVVHALRMGGLENGLVNLVNRTPVGRYRHAIVCMTRHDRFAQRIERPDVELFALDKRAGKDPGAYLRLWRLLRRLRPDIVHTRNLAAVDAHVPAFLAGVPGRIHGEHGRDMVDLHGSNRRYRVLRRALRPLIHQWVPLSADLERYVRDAIGVSARRITRICNGVDLARFRPDAAARSQLRAEAGWPDDTLVLGWVGRMEPVKNPLGLVEAFDSLRRAGADADGRLRLAMIGDGGQRDAVAAAIDAAGLGDRVWRPGARDDVPALLAGFDVFVLPSLAEGISNTVLEALACGVPVVATDVGGNRDLVGEEGCGSVVPADDTAALAEALRARVDEPDGLSVACAAARRRAEREFGIDGMVAAYLDLYDRVLAAGRGARATATERTGIV